MDDRIIQKIEPPPSDSRSKPLFLRILWSAAFIVLALVFSACALSLNATCQQLYADAIIPVLTSLYHWEPFFWGGARYGMLIPLLAKPISMPLWNLIFQNLVSTGLLLASPFVIARFVYGAGYGSVVGLGTSLILVLVYANTHVVIYMSPGQPYGMALAFCYGGLWLIESLPLRLFSRVVPGVLSILAALWLCPTVAVGAAGIIVAKVLLEMQAARTEAQTLRLKRAVKKRLPQIICLTAGLVASTAFTLSRPVSDGRRLTSLLTPSEWLNQNGLSRLVEGFVKWFVSPIPYGRTIFVVLCGCAILVNVLVRRHPSRRHRGERNHRVGSRHHFGNSYPQLDALYRYEQL